MNAALFWHEAHALGIPLFAPSVELLWKWHLHLQRVVLRRLERADYFAKQETSSTASSSTSPTSSGSAGASTTSPTTTSTALPSVSDVVNKGAWSSIQTSGSRGALVRMFHHCCHHV